MERSPDWEGELWRCVSAGNGVVCPLQPSCAVERAPGDACDHAGSETPARPGRGRGLAYHMFGCASPEAPIRGRIFELVERLSWKFLQAAGVTGPPVPWDLVEHFRLRPPVEVRTLPLLALHGAVWRRVDAWVVYVNRNDPPDRQRYTLFHELFHVLAHARGTPVFHRLGREQGAFNEMLADYFSVCTVLPAAWVGERAREGRSVRRLAEEFDVRPSAMARRLMGLGLTPRR